MERKNTVSLDIPIYASFDDVAVTDPNLLGEGRFLVEHEHRLEDRRAGRVTFGLNYSEVARAFGRDRTTAAHACQLIEERRDDPAVDAVLGSLEDACGTLRRKLSAPVHP